MLAQVATYQRVGKAAQTIQDKMDEQEKKILNFRTIMDSKDVNYHAYTIL